MRDKVPPEKIKTGVETLDAILEGGLPKGSMTVFAGTPGSGKTILSQQIGFFNATKEKPAIFFQTLSEPTAKTLNFASQFSYFDQSKVSDSAHFIDLGDIMRSKGVEHGVKLLIDAVVKIKPALVVIDSFKAFEDITSSSEELRKFTYEVAIKLLAWQCTTLLLGEFGKTELESSPLLSIVDGIFVFSQKQVAGHSGCHCRVREQVARISD
jgi:circadian clock protein KaiC